jgi:hypothetical protein
MFGIPSVAVVVDGGWFGGKLVKLSRRGWFGTWCREGDHQGGRKEENVV